MTRSFCFSKMGMKMQKTTEIGEAGWEVGLRNTERNKVKCKEQES